MGVKVFPSRERGGNGCGNVTLVGSNLFLPLKIPSNITVITLLIGQRVILWLNALSIKSHSQTFCSVLFVSELSGLFSVCLVPLLNSKEAEFSLSPTQITLHFRVNDCIWLIGISLYRFKMNSAFDF